MFGENNNQAGDNSVDNQGQDPFAVFNEPFTMLNEDDVQGTQIPMHDWTQNNEEENDLTNQNNNDDVTNQQAASQQAENNNQNANDDLVFDDEVKTTSTQDELNEEEIIAKLKEKGYDVAKKDAVPEDKKQEIELKRIDSFLEQANNFITQNDETVVKEKLKNDLAKSYIAKGKQHLIGTEDFEIDLEAEYSEYEDNATLRKLYAENVRRDVKELIAKNESEKNKITQETEKEIQSRIAENKMKLQETIKDINKQGIFGLQVSVDAAKEIYKSVVDGSFTKAVNSDPSLVAEFATYLKYREDIKKTIGGPTYGEGVKAAVDALAGNEKTATKSPLTQAMNNASSQGQGGALNRKQSWALPTVNDEQADNKKPYVAGEIKTFL